MLIAAVFSARKGAASPHWYFDTYLQINLYTHIYMYACTYKHRLISTINAWRYKHVFTVVVVVVVELWRSLNVGCLRYLTLNTFWWNVFSIKSHLWLPHAYAYSCTSNFCIQTYILHTCAFKIILKRVKICIFSFSITNHIIAQKQLI